MKTKTFLLIIIGLSLVESLFGQPKTKAFPTGIREITSGNFYDAYRGATELTSTVTHRSIDKGEIFKDEKLYYTEEIVDEVIAPDKKRFLMIEKRNDLTTQSELIKIGNIFYCRENNGEWKQAKVWCGASTVRGIPNNEIVSKFTMETTKLNNRTVKIYQDFTTYRDKDTRRFWKSKFWVDEKGLMMREERSSGLAEPETVSYKSETIYDYNPQNLRIEAPVIKSITKPNPK